MALLAPLCQRAPASRAGFRPAGGCDFLLQRGPGPAAAARL